ncbi:alpha-amylase family glycosyl hydrolase [Tellurirhabdus rosea]|uniref:alpha-amylase family glycosyl hydrolase n=1 Tax=Tellurirhabdus rosea TaxID=2674997 RepID=UPI002255EF93|nr:alpha-amylase family glycosyl hydrolase [Tellurirhabdus rosea]
MTDFTTRYEALSSEITRLYDQLYGQHPRRDECLADLYATLKRAFENRPEALRRRDGEKAAQESDRWFTSNQLAGMSLYVDRFCENLPALPARLAYLQDLGVNLLHLMPLFESPAGESDGGYAVSDFRKVDPRFGTLDDLKSVQSALQEQDMYLMLDIVLNHTSHRHAWAEKARQGDPVYQDYFYFFPDRTLPDQFEASMPEIFPESAPGSFSYVPECGKWVMTVFHNYQWDLNYANPRVFVEMLDTIFFYANLGVDVLRIDAPAFIWKQVGTSCQNLPEAHQLLRLIRQCVAVATPGMALLGEAIVAPAEIMKYFGEGPYAARECDFAYNATQMALQWDALATGKTQVMLAAQPELQRKPRGTSWITYTRCHDDIGLGYDDAMIRQAGFEPYPHRRFLMNYYSGQFPGSPASGALFSVNDKTGDARISGSLASLCGLEKALAQGNGQQIELAIRKILLMQAQSIFAGGLPMLFYGDEAGYTNDYSYLGDPGKNYDNRWMHRPVIDWEKNQRVYQPDTIENRVFAGTQKLLALRKKLDVVTDRSNQVWLSPHNSHVTGYLREWEGQRLYCVFNYSDQAAYLTWYAYKEHGFTPARLVDHWQGTTLTVGLDHEYHVIEPYGFCILEVSETRN